MKSKTHKVVLTGLWQSRLTLKGACAQPALQAPYLAVAKVQALRLRPGLATLALLCVASLLLTTSATGGPLPARASASLNTTVRLPLIMKSGCDPIPGATYGTLAPTNPNGGVVENDHRINLGLRGYVPNGAFAGLITIGGVGDPNAPQFPGLFADKRTPTFSNSYAVRRWDSTCNCPGEPITDPQVTLAGLTTTPGETIHVPNSGYDIGGGNDVLVLYASTNRLTLKYTREDDIVSGYTVYLENVCVEPSLLALYQALNAAGRGQLPALQGGQALGRAIGNEIGVAVRDSGTFQDPRSRNSWWIGR